jgi:carbon storage regulator
VIVISRIKGEGLVFGDDITLTVIEIRGDKVRLGVELPQGGTVHRGEVYDAILSQKEGGQGAEQISSPLP